MFFKRYIDKINSDISKTVASNNFCKIAEPTEYKFWNDNCVALSRSNPNICSKESTGCQVIQHKTLVPRSPSWHISESFPKKKKIHFVKSWSSVSLSRDRKTVYMCILPSPPVLFCVFFFSQCMVIEWKCWYKPALRYTQSIPSLRRGKNRKKEKIHILLKAVWKLSRIMHLKNVEEKNQWERKSC